MTPHIMVVGTSEPQDFQLLEDGVAKDGTGWDVDIEWRDSPDTPPTVAWLVQASGTVRVTGTESMAVGQYRFRFSLTDGGGDVGYVPNLDKEANVWRVVRL